MPTRFCFLILSSLLLVPDAPRTCAQGSPYRFDVHRNRIELQLYAPHIIRIRVSPDSAIPAAPSLSVTAVPAHVESAATVKGDTLVISTREMTVRINRLNGDLRFSDRSGAVFLAADSLLVNRTIEPDLIML